MEEWKNGRLLRVIALQVTGYEFRVMGLRVAGWQVRTI